MELRYVSALNMGSPSLSCKHTPALAFFSHQKASGYVNGDISPIDPWTTCSSWALNITEDIWESDGQAGEVVL